MHIGKKYKLSEVVAWTSTETVVFIVLATIPTVLYWYFDWQWISIPWLPVSLVGTAVAFLIGFRNNTSYNRLLSAQVNWRSIVSSSRSWAMMTIDYIYNFAEQETVTEQDISIIHKRIIYRHLAWLTALRFELRQTKAWENTDKYGANYLVPERESEMEVEIAPLLNSEDYEYVMSKSNKTTHILRLQSKDITELKKQGFIDASPYIEMQRMLSSLLIYQGNAQGVKDAPYPRQFSTFNRYFVGLFILLLPLGILHEISQKLEDNLIWLTIPFTVLIAWVFHTMEKIGQTTVNPFEGGVNDIPLTTLCRNIEIDLREMLGETEIPGPVQPVNDILM